MFRPDRCISASAWLALTLLAGLSLSPKLEAQPPGESTDPAAPPPTATGPQPFGANLFTGSFAAQREDGQNPEYQILSGDRVMVNAWGALTINDVFVVDSQGNIFLPGIGPVLLSGVRNGDLTQAVQNSIRRVYRANFGVYTNLMTASPVAVFVTGGVQRPGRYAGIPSDSVLFYLDQAGGIDPHAGSYRQVSVVREGNTIAELDLYDFLVRGNLQNPQFVDGDTILVGRRGPTVEVHGATPHPTLVEVGTDEIMGAQVLDVLRRVARVNEVTVRGVRGSRPVVQTVPVAAFRETPLQDGDVLEFREEGRAGGILVRIQGEFEGPSVMSVRRGTRLVDLLNHVRVDSNLANTPAVHIKRLRVAEQQRESIGRSLDQLERSAMLALSDTRGEAEIRVREAELVRQFVERARQVQPLGRVVTTTAGHQLNVLLQEGDVVVIPPRNNIVRISGEVHVTQALMYRPDLRARDYVRMAGGYTNRAETDAVIVLRANAGVTIGDGDVPIHPGDEILVPASMDDKFLQNVIDASAITQTIYQIAVATSILIGL